MGFQGKGILGGFSGKVGGIQGLRRNGKDLIQSCPKFATRVLGWLWDFEFAECVEPVNAIIVGDTVAKDGSGNDWSSGALLPYSFGKRIGGVQFDIMDLNNQVHIVLGNLDGDYDYRLSPVSLGLTNINCAVYRFGTRVTPFIKLSNPDSLRMVITSNFVEILHQMEGTEYVCIFREFVEYELPVQMFFSMKGINTNVSGVKQGGTSLILN